MSELELNKLFEKRVIAYWIDLLVFIYIMGNFSTWYEYSFPNDSPFFGLFFPILFYYSILPILTRGRTLGLFVMKLKIVTKNNYIFYGILNPFRIIYSILTLYIFRIFLFPKMNNLGQLNFDEIFNTSIINSNDNINFDNRKEYFEVNCNPLIYFKLFFFLIVITIVLGLIDYFIETMIT